MNYFLSLWLYGNATMMPYTYTYMCTHCAYNYYYYFTQNTIAEIRKWYTAKVAA